MMIIIRVSNETYDYYNYKDLNFSLFLYIFLLKPRLYKFFYQIKRNFFTSNFSFLKHKKFKFGIFQNF